MESLETGACSRDVRASFNEEQREVSKSNCRKELLLGAMPIETQGGSSLFIHLKAQSMQQHGWT